MARDGQYLTTLKHLNVKNCELDKVHFEKKSLFVTANLEADLTFSFDHNE